MRVTYEQLAFMVEAALSKCQDEEVYSIDDLLYWLNENGDRAFVLEEE